MPNPEYQRGYLAGRKKRAADEREEFRRAVFLAVIAELTRNDNTFRQGETKLTSVTQRVEVAWDFAKEAMARF